ncbi:WXG100 family type VII secretion target [Nocardioides sp. zg-536]|uniref:WXG100 family type VII secretion target n=1 Tax=Nocardioides faecalis TaxID=2803858 RepID=A0A938Y9K4_9ACTN|nr:WXG100 family type VII secretion target [Nocardioides faecalis]MBM9461692.1 WXG100 family type VII secretion target [Nocardioides faecalis]MBS4752108.1 WXG100 family type VII secretion target [Nocardioides faecalis]QVI59082.1 WXG100 family type VII secretion target [Nocardioides faecalis]
MAGSNIEFGHAEGALKQIAERVVQAKQEFTQHSNTLDGQIQGLKGKWEGDGGRAFMVLHNAWTEKHKVITTALDKFHASLTETEADNVAVDQGAGSNMNTLINKLGQL